MSVIFGRTHYERVIFVCSGFIQDRCNLRWVAWGGLISRKSKSEGIYKNDAVARLGPGGHSKWSARLSSVAVALNAPHTLHRVKPQPHLSTSHRTSTRHTASHTSESSTAVHTSSAAARAVNTRTGKALVAGSKATLHTAVVRRHRYYERFTASS